MDQVSDNSTIFGTFNLEHIIGELPPAPDSEARHRAETLIKTDTLRVVLVTMLSGGLMHEHTAPGPITIQVLRGSVNVRVEGATHTLGESELISLAPHVVHSVEGIEDGAFLLTIAHLSRIPDEGGDI